MSEYYPPAGFYFKVTFENPKGGLYSETSFKEVSGLTVDNSPEEVTEGGLLEYRHRLPTAAKYSNLVLKRGLVTDSKLRTWVEDGLKKFEYTPLVVTIELLNQFADEGANPAPLMSWKVYNAWPVKWEVSQFESMSNDIVIETLELAFSYFETKAAS